MNPEEIKLVIRDLVFKVVTLIDYKVINALGASENVITDSGKAKHNACQIQNDRSYGVIMVDLVKLLNEMVLHAYRGGDLVLQLWC